MPLSPRPDSWTMIIIRHGPDADAWTRRLHAQARILHAVCRPCPANYKRLAAAYRHEGIYTIAQN